MYNNYRLNFVSFDEIFVKLSIMKRRKGKIKIW